MAFYLYILLMLNIILAKKRNLSNGRLPTPLEAHQDDGRPIAESDRPSRRQRRRLRVQQAAATVFVVAKVTSAAFANQHRVKVVHGGEKGPAVGHFGLLLCCLNYYHQQMVE